MKRPVLLLVATIAMASLLGAACTQAAPPATPTKTQAAPTKVAEPTKPAAAAPTPTKAPPEPTKAAVQPTAAPAKKVDFPTKGKTITIIMPWPAGGSTDLGARVLASVLERDLGVPVQVVNKAGASGQLGATDIATAKPDGYTIGYTNIPVTITTYLDPERKSVFTRRSFEPIALAISDPIVMTVQAGSPYKTAKDLVDAAKASPEKVKAAVSGIMTSPHLAALQLEKTAGIKFASVHFDGTGPNLTAVLGGHVDVAFNTSEAVPQVKAGAIRVLGVADTQESRFYPGSKTLESQGYKVYMDSGQGLSAPAGTPKEIIDLLSASIKKALGSDEVKGKLAEMGAEPRYLDAAAFAARWDGMESTVKPLMELVKK